MAHGSLSSVTASRPCATIMAVLQIRQRGWQTVGGHAIVLPEPSDEEDAVGEASSERRRTGGACGRCPSTLVAGATWPRAGGPTTRSGRWWPRGSPTVGDAGVPRALEGAAVGGHLRRRRPGGPRRWPARCRPDGVGPGDVVAVPAPQLGRGRHHLLGRGLPRRGRRARSSTSTGPRRSTTSSARPRPTSSSPPTGSATTTTSPPTSALLRRPARPAVARGRRRRRRPSCPPARRRSSRCSTASRSPARCRSTPTRRPIIAFTSGTTRDPKGVVHSHRTIGFETRQLDYMFPTGGPPQITGAPVGHFIGMLNAFLVPLLRERPVNLIDVWDPGEVLRHDDRGGARRVAAAPPTSSPACSTTRTSPPEHLALMPFAGLGRLDRAGGRHRAGHQARASRCSARTGAPSTRRSPAASLDEPEEKRLTTDGHALPGVEMRLDDDGEILEPGPGLLRRLHRRRR